MSDLWTVAVDAPLPEPLTYKSNPDFQDHIQRGVLVHVPLGRRKVRGLVLGPQNQAPEMTLKAIDSIDSEYPALPDHFSSWLEWIANYYMYPIGEVCSLSYPPLSRSNERKTRKTEVIKAQAPSVAPRLTEDQSKIIADISKHKNFSTHLIFGVTGSGKTEVYIQLLEKVLSEGKKGLVLVPEISLTPQLIQRFAARFGQKVAVLHSQLTDRERTNQWWDIIEGRKQILIGARSALFCPIENLGIIVVDEEHEPSFKQDETLKYHGRDAAIMLGKFADCPVVLGSATPSLESWKNAKEGKYYLHQMNSRVESRALPEVQVIDLRQHDEKSKEISDLPFWLSPLLYEKMQQTLEQKKQVALFLNRRGVAPLVICPECGFTHECPNCDINLTLHGKSHLVCHYCDYHENLKEICPDCHEGELKPTGLGTELVENDLQNLFPGAVIARADRDEIQNRDDLEELVYKMEMGETNILVGTQMIAKGLDFPHLHLVGLVLADVGFNLPDFRSTERSFQLITQVSGRAGRHVKSGESPGQVVVQTYNPDHPSLQFALKNDFVGFAEQELVHREQLLYPPFGKIAVLRVQSQQLAKSQQTARLLARRGTQLKSMNPLYSDIEVLGPAEAPLSKLRGHFRFHLLIKARSNKTLNAFCRQLISNEDWIPSGARVSVDVDPIHLL